MSEEGVRVRDEATSQHEIDVERHILGLTVKLSDGTLGHIYERSSKRKKDGSFTYDCRLCAVGNLPGERCLHTHIAGRKHQSKLTLPVFDANTFWMPIHRTRILPAFKVDPVEPILPSVKESDEKLVSQLQTTLDACRTHSLVGVEYVLELTNEMAVEPSYHCLMCDKRADGRTIMYHLKSYTHRLRYLEKHFPTVVKEIHPYRFIKDREITTRIMLNICNAIESSHGRMMPSVYDQHTYEKNKMRVLQTMNNAKHIDEKMGMTFVHVVDHKAIQRAIDGDLSALGIEEVVLADDDDASNGGQAGDAAPDPASPQRRESLDSISSASSASLSTGQNARSRSPKRQGGANPDGKERFVWEKYRCMLELARTELETKYNGYKAVPEHHPRYPDEWKTFWCRRYKELQAAKKDPSKHDFKAEWIVFWVDRMKELLADEIDAKKTELRERLKLPDAEPNAGDRRAKPSKSPIALRRKSNEGPRPMRRRSSRSPIDRRDHRRVGGRASVSRSSRSPSARRSRRTRSRSPAPRRRSRSRSRSTYSRPPSGRQLRSTISPLSDDDDVCIVESGSTAPKRMSGPLLMVGPGPYPSGGPAGPPPYFGNGASVDEWGRPLYYGAPLQQHVRNPYEPPPYMREATAKPVINHARFVVKNSTNRAVAGRSATPADGEDVSAAAADDENVTVISVLRLLTALEELLGSLGPKVIDLLAKALALEKVKANSSDDMLINDDTCVLFETIKEKLKGQLIADVVEPLKIAAVKRAVKNVALIIHLVSDRAKREQKDKEKSGEASVVPVPNVPLAPPAQLAPVASAQSAADDRETMAKQIAHALTVQGKTDISAEQLAELINLYEQMRQAKQADASLTAVSYYQQTAPTANSLGAANGADTSDPAGSSLDALTDTDLQTLLHNFAGLTEDEQSHLISYMKKLESTQPARVASLRKFIDLDALSASKSSDVADDADDRPSEPQPSVKGPSTMSTSANGRDAIAEADKGKSSVASETVTLDSDDDEDDYSYDEVFRAASQRVHEKQLAEQRQKVEAERKRKLEEDFTSAGRGASSLTLADTQNMIANLMGSLQKTVQTKGIRAQQLQQKPTGKEVNLDEFGIEPLAAPGTDTNAVGPANGVSQPMQQSAYSAVNTNIPYYQQQQDYQQESAGSSSNQSVVAYPMPVQAPMHGASQPPLPAQPPPPLPPQPMQQDGSGGSDASGVGNGYGQQQYSQYAQAPVQYPGYEQNVSGQQQQAWSAYNSADPSLQYQYQMAWWQQQQQQQQPQQPYDQQYGADVGQQQQYQQQQQYDQQQAYGNYANAYAGNQQHY